MQIWLICDILLVNECCGTLGTAVNEAYFALFSMGAQITGVTPNSFVLIPDRCLFIYFDTTPGKSLDWLFVALFHKPVYNCSASSAAFSRTMNFQLTVKYSVIYCL